MGPRFKESCTCRRFITSSGIGLGLARFAAHLRGGLYQLSPLDRRQPVNELRHTPRQPAVNDQNATNVAAIVISGEHRNTANGVVIMPAFGNA